MRQTHSEFTERSHRGQDIPHSLSFNFVFSVFGVHGKRYKMVAVDALEILTCTTSSITNLSKQASLETTRLVSGSTSTRTTSLCLSLQSDSHPSRSAARPLQATIRPIRSLNRKHQQRLRAQARRGLLPRRMQRRMQQLRRVESRTDRTRQSQRYITLHSG